MNELRAPFPYFGGKSRVADVVWRAFGNVPNFVEPFCGSLAVILARPQEPKIETVNDADCMIANFWRSVQSAPEEVARWCDGPVNEADLHARHQWLVTQLKGTFRENMLSDPHFCDCKIAGWWVWGISQWIGGGWCHVGGAKERNTRSRSRPDLDGHGQGVHKLWPPDLRGGGRGIAAPGRRPSSRSSGVTSDSMIATHLPSLGNMRGVLGESKSPCLEWFRALQTRLRRVRVVCGDWKRVLGDSVLGTTKSRNSGMNPCGLFFDPPYSHEERDPDLYAEDSSSIASEVREWAIARADDPDLRIALCGYEGEHDMPETWTKHAWKAHRGYASAENENIHRERIWFSPHCLALDPPQQALFR